MEKVDLLLQGAIDMHAHGYPQFTLNMPPRVNNYEWVQAAVDAGMAVIVIKSHIWPTANEAYLLNRMVEGVKVLGSITLNYTVGGLDPLAVQIAAESGARVVFMPTWCSKNDISKGMHYADRMRPFVTIIDEAMKEKTGLTVFDRDGELIPEMTAIIDICKQYSLVLASGHLSIEESIMLCKAATAAGVKFVLNHPLSTPLIGASVDQMKEVAESGGYIENCFIGCMPMHEGMNPKRIVEVINHIGAERCTMATDAIEAWNPPAPEILRMYIATMLALGVSEEDVYKMTHTNPAYLLGMDICGSI